MSYSNFLESAILTWMMGNYTVYVGYGTASAGEDGSGLSEPSGGGYAREAYGAYTVTNSGDDYYAENDSAITFDTATASQGTITHVYFFDALSGGNFLGEVSFSELGLDNVPIVTGGNLQFPAQGCKITLD